MSKIIFERSGGLSGQDISLDLDLSTLPASEALSLIHQIQKCDFFHLPMDNGGRATPDEFVYTITAEIGSARHTVRTTEKKAPDVMRPMLNLLSSIAIVS